MADSQTPDIADAGFETPALTAMQYQVAPTGSGWTWTGGAGITGSQSPYTANNYAHGSYPPEGSQVAYFQTSPAAASQILNFPVGGTFQFTMQMAQRIDTTLNQQDVTFSLDGVAIATITPTSEAYASYTTPTFSATAGNHTLTISGNNTAGGDNTAFVDAITITAVTTTPTPTPTSTTLVAGTLTAGPPTTSAVVLTLSGTAGGSPPYSVQFQQAPDLGGAPGTWSNLGLAGATTTFTAGPLTAGTTYWFRAIVLASASTSASGAVTVAISATTVAIPDTIVPPSVGPISIQHVYPTDVIAFSSVTAGSFPIAFIGLYITSDTYTGDATLPVAVVDPDQPVKMIGFTPPNSHHYVIRAADTASPPNLSPPSNEVIGGAAPPVLRR